jgi:hypothetical protein
MRRFTRLSALTLGAGALAFGVLAPGAGAGLVPEEGAAPLTIVKAVTAPFPAGTTFTATISCVPDEDEVKSADGMIDNGEDGTNEATVTFGADGQPTSPDTITFDGPGVCTVTETVTGGATSTTYACVGTLPEPPDDEVPAPTDGAGSFQVEEPLGTVCPSAGPQAAPITVNIIAPNQDATVTITNTPPTQQIKPAAQIVAQPAFTG